MTIFNDRMVISSLDNDVLFEFNMPGNGNSRWWCDEMTGWKNTADLNVTLNTYGTSDGASPANRFPAKERYITLEGAFAGGSREIAEQQMDALVNAVRPGQDFFIERYEPVPKRMKVRLASSIEFPQQFEREFRWLMTLVVPSSVKESVTEYSGFVNSYIGGLVYREYTGQTDGDTNWVINSSFEVDVTTGVTTYNSATVTWVNTPTPAAGLRQARVQTGVATSYSGIAIATPSVTPNSYDQGHWNGSASVRGNAGGEVVEAWLKFNYADGTTSEGTRTSLTLTTTYQTISCGADPDGDKEINFIQIHVRPPGGTAGVVYFVDRVHVNYGPTNTPYVNGGANTSSFFAGTANVSVSSTQAFPKVPGKRSYSNYTRSYTTGSLIGEGFTELAVVDNEGNGTAYPVTTVTGPLYSGGWELRNETTGDRLSFRVDIPEGFALVIDHRARTAVMNGQHLEFRKDGVWWGLAPGANQLRLATDEFNEAATATFSYRDAWRN